MYNVLACNQFQVSDFYLQLDSNLSIMIMYYSKKDNYMKV